MWSITKETATGPSQERRRFRTLYAFFCSVASTFCEADMGGGGGGERGRIRGGVREGE